MQADRGWFAQRSHAAWTTKQQGGSPGAEAIATGPKALTRGGSRFFSDPPSPTQRKVAGREQMERTGSRGIRRPKERSVDTRDWGGLEGWFSRQSRVMVGGWVFWGRGNRIGLRSRGQNKTGCAAEAIARRTEGFSVLCVAFSRPSAKRHADVIGPRNEPGWNGRDEATAAKRQQEENRCLEGRDGRENNRRARVDVRLR
ncbi:hypothetical protein PVAR5_8897 [Paecilomyces variotii No. 5]|uniref:Uncharacterized protein n=1 Tax=Byssochlamys spectabilis (strain No. 5 / NBRC 109023) TaxID=1356009 RepID=V5I661_BYSSN|nr:hypothetical protein PVAR5_8897 [Paecilomyces variotii No. 5]